MKRISILLLALACALAPAAAAQTVKTLLSFSGTESEGNLILDSAGNLYGTTGDQYDPSLITVFQLSPNGDGTWTENVLWTSTGGSDPLNIRAGVVFDASGNLYGTSLLGGASDCGTVFKLTHNSDGSWSERNLVDFDCGTNGAYPVTGVTLDEAGNVYGGTNQGGTFGNGVIFQLTPNSDGSYSEKVIHHFTDGADGGYPDHQAFIFDSGGNLYGTTSQGGVQGNCNLPVGTCGTVFKLAPKSGGRWALTVIHTFTGATDGGSPEATLVFDKSGNLYGTTYVGGQYGLGVAYKLIPHANGKWGETVLHAFKGSDGANPLGGVIFDSAGNLFGTTANGGQNQCFNAPGCGIVYELMPKSSGGYTQDVLVRFHGAPNSGPYSDLVMDSTGNLYGSATDYNTYSSGTIYEVIR